MKLRVWFPVVLIGCVMATTAPAVNAQSILGRLRQKVKDKVEQKTAPSIPSEAAPAASNSSTAAATSGGSTAANGGASGTDPNNIQSYQNYDFVPGATIIFDDDFTDSQDGEFPAQWNLLKGQAVVNQQQGYQAFLLTDGNYAQVSPRMKTKTYLGPDFTVEYDEFYEPGTYPLHVELDDTQDQDVAVYVSNSEAAVEGKVSFDGSLPPAIRSDAFENKWHHVAIVYRKPQIKVYVDQYRVLTVPDIKIEPASMILEGIGDQQKPIIFRNVRVADGGGMNMIGKKFTDAKIVTHGVNFDIDKATLRPESMGTLNQIKALMTSDPTLKFEIDGHTDNTGEAAHNMTLSQERADAVKAQLVTMGISADRLTTKGFGDTKPITSNDTPEGKANNRRVEFVRTSS